MKFNTIAEKVKPQEHTNATIDATLNKFTKFVVDNDIKSFEQGIDIYMDELSDTLHNEYEGFAEEHENSELTDMLYSTSSGVYQILDNPIYTNSPAIMGWFGSILGSDAVLNNYIIGDIKSIPQEHHTQLISYKADMKKVRKHIKENYGDMLTIFTTSPTSDVIRGFTELSTAVDGTNNQLYKMEIPLNDLVAVEPINSSGTNMVIATNNSKNEATEVVDIDKYIPQELEKQANILVKAYESEYFSKYF